MGVRGWAEVVGEKSTIIVTLDTIKLFVVTEQKTEERGWERK